MVFLLTLGYGLLRPRPVHHPREKEKLAYAIMIDIARHCPPESLFFRRVLSSPLLLSDLGLHVSGSCPFPMDRSESYFFVEYLAADARSWTVYAWPVRYGLFKGLDTTATFAIHEPDESGTYHAWAINDPHYEGAHQVPGASDLDVASESGHWKQVPYGAKVEQVDPEYCKTHHPGW